MVKVAIAVSETKSRFAMFRGGMKAHWRGWAGTSALFLAASFAIYYCCVGVDYEGPLRFAYAATANQCFRRLDESLMRTDPSYGTSRRRLAVLRSVTDLGVNVYQAAYVTNAIAELVAYPESELPE